MIESPCSTLVARLERLPSKAKASPLERAKNDVTQLLGAREESAFELAQKYGDDRRPQRIGYFDLVNQPAYDGNPKRLIAVHLLGDLLKLDDVRRVFLVAFNEQHE